MGISDMFGGSKQIEVLTRDQKRLLGGLTDVLGAELGHAGPVYGGQVSPDANANQQFAFDNALPGIMGQTGDTNAAVQSMLAGESAMGPIDQERYFNEAIYNPALQAYQDSQKQLEAQYGGSWGQTGGFQDIMQEGAARFATGIGQQHGQFMLDQQNIANQRQAQGVQGSFGQQQNLANSYANLLGIGGEERSIEGQGLAEAYNKWQAGQDYSNPWLGFLGPALGTQAYAVGQDPGIVSGISESYKIL